MFLDKLIQNIILFLLRPFLIKKGDIAYLKNFEFFEKHNLHITYSNFYSPIPKTSDLEKTKYTKLSQLPGIDMQYSQQILLFKKLTNYFHELSNFTYNLDEIKNIYEFSFNNMAFDHLDAAIYYSMIRKYKPKKIIEIGSGWSTKIASKAIVKNKVGELYAIEPYPQNHLVSGFPGFTKLISRKVEDVNLSFFQKLSENDFLFIDSSHVVRTNGDVNFEFLEILPRLKKGVFIHIHDIFFPEDYPWPWVKNEKRFWSEQYILQALLQHSFGYKVILCNSWLTYEKKKILQQYLPKHILPYGASMWIQKTV